MAYEDVFDFLVFKSRFADLETVSDSPAAFSAAVAKVNSFISPQVAELNGISTTYDAASDLPDLSGSVSDSLGKTARAAKALADSMSELTANVEGMLLEVQSQAYVDLNFPDDYFLFLRRAYVISPSFSDEELRELLADNPNYYGVNAAQYQTIRTDFIALNEKAKTWQSKSAAVQQAAKNYADAIVASEFIGGVESALTVIGATRAALAAKSVGGAVFDVALTIAKDKLGINVDGEDWAQWAGVQWLKDLTGAYDFNTELLDAFQSSTGVRVILSDGQGYLTGFQNDVLLISADRGAAGGINVNTDAIQTWNLIQNLVVVGSGSNDTIEAKNVPAGEVVVVSEGGIDTIKIGVGAAVSPANVKIDSGADNDTIEVQAGSADIKSGGGVDTISLFLGGEFTVDAGGEKDTIRIGDIGSSVINGGEGEDTVDFSGKDLPGLNPVASGVKFNLAEQGAGLRVQQGGVNHTLVSIENIFLTQFEDEVTGDGRDNIFEGLGGDDTLVGGGGNDTLDGGENYDTVDYSKEAGGSIAILAGGANISVIDGSGGRDTLIAIEEIIATGKKDVLKLSSMDLGVGSAQKGVDVTQIPVASRFEMVERSNEQIEGGMTVVCLRSMLSGRATLAKIAGATRAVVNDTLRPEHRFAA
jgi:Ca2+-binding RTX toxin-like protein